tara:strand:+ start:584 stop:787 length:204 start_codon:yes stop_codon:yes gene_type:complete
MAEETSKQFEFFCTLKESAAQITESALQAFNHSLESFNWDDLSSDEQRAIKDWHLDLQSANKALNEA